MDFDVLLTRDPDGVVIARVPSLQGCHSWGRTEQEALQNIEEAIALCLEDEDDYREEFVAVRKVSVTAA